MDSLGRTFLTIAHNKFESKMGDGSVETVEERYPTHVVLDIEGNQREVVDARPRRPELRLRNAGSQIHSVSMDAGERWMLNDVAGQPIRTWDARGHEARTQYDQLHRPVCQLVRGTDRTHRIPESLIGTCFTPKSNTVRGRRMTWGWTCGRGRARATTTPE